MLNKLRFSVHALTFPPFHTLLKSVSIRRVRGRGERNEEGRTRKVSPALSFPFSSAWTSSLSSFHACPALRNDQENKRRSRGETGFVPLICSFGLHFFCPPLPPSSIFISLRLPLLGLNLSLALSVSLFFLSFLILVLSLLPFLPGSQLSARQETQRKESERAVGEEGPKVSDEKNTSLLSSSTSSSGFITNETVRYGKSKE